MNLGTKTARSLGLLLLWSLAAPVAGLYPIPRLIPLPWPGLPSIPLIHQFLLLRVCEIYMPVSFLLFAGFYFSYSAFPCHHKHYVCHPSLSGLVKSSWCVSSLSMWLICAVHVIMVVVLAWLLIFISHHTQLEQWLCKMAGVLWLQSDYAEWLVHSDCAQWLCSEEWLSTATGT